MGEQGSILGVWREALAIIRRYPSAVMVPAAVLGALAEAPAYLIEDRALLDQVLTYVTAALAYYLYLAYAEGLTTDYERGTDLIAAGGTLGELRQAVPFVPRVLAAALVTLAIASAATGLLVVPGAWLFTRWSLSTPAICKEGLGALEALRWSSTRVRWQLVRSRGRTRGGSGSAARSSRRWPYRWPPLLPRWLIQGLYSTLSRSKGSKAQGTRRTSEKATLSALRIPLRAGH
jgi:hypothetical protein